MNTHLTLADVKAAYNDYASNQDRIVNSVVPYYCGLAVAVGAVVAIVFDRWCGVKMVGTSSQLLREITLIARPLVNLVAFGVGVVAFFSKPVLYVVSFIYFKDALGLTIQIEKCPKDFQQQLPAGGSLLRKALNPFGMDQTSRLRLIEKMSLEQLSETRSILGVKRFSKLTQKSSAPNVALWKDLEKIAFALDSKVIFKNLERLQAFKDKIWYAPFLSQLDKEMQARKIYGAVRAHLLRMAPQTDLVKFDFDHLKFPPIIVREEVAQKLSGPILPLGLGILWHDHGKVIDSRKGKTHSHPDQVPFPSTRGRAEFFTQSRYPTFKRIVERLDGVKVQCSLDNLLDDLKFADLWMNVEIFKIIERELVQFPIPETYESYKRIGEFYQTGIDSPVKEYFLKKTEILFNNTIHSEEENALMVPLEDKAQVVQRLQEAPSPNLLAVIYRNCDEREFMEVFAVVKDKLINKKYVKSLYDFFSTCKDQKGFLIVKACIAFNKTLTFNERYEAWGAFPPKELKGGLFI